MNTVDQSTDKKLQIYFLSLNAIRFTPYAYGMLRAWCDRDERLKASYHWHEPFCRPEPVKDLAARIIGPHVLCASCYVWNHNQHLAVAQLVKKKYPHCRVIFGGPHVPGDAGDYLEKYSQVDIVVHDEGETALRALLLTWLDGSNDLERVPGISYRAGSKIKRNPVQGLPADLPIPSPYLSGYLDHFLEVNKGHAIALWETNRGCPYRCRFCDWGARSTNRIRRHDMDKVAAEIDYLAGKNVADIYITDCNFGLLPRDLEIARLLKNARRKTGFPERVRIQFAKQSDRRVLEISRLLHAEGMLWGTTLSMQSVSPAVLKAVHRGFLGLEKYRRLKDRYLKLSIPTYTELILGLPLETRKSFVEGICRLMQIGIHDDIRIYELALLPNAPLSRPDQRRLYNLQTRFKPLRITPAGQPREEVELVFATSTMTVEDWAWCMLFGEVIQALHNGGYTRFLSIYLARSGKLPYQRFYQDLIGFMLKDQSPAFGAVRRLEKLIFEFYHDPDMPQINRLLVRADTRDFLAQFNPRRKGWPLWSYLWLWTAVHFDDFSSAMGRFLEQYGLNSDACVRDLLRYQEELMLRPDYEPAKGKHVGYKYDWLNYFFGDGRLHQRSVQLHYTDSHMGIGKRYPLRANDPMAFLAAAVGMSYPYSKHRHFFHQPDATIVN